MARLDEACVRVAERLTSWTEREREFLDGLIDRGTIAAELLTDDPKQLERIEMQPLLQWKAQNVEEFRRRGDAG